MEKRLVTVKKNILELQRTHSITLGNNLSENEFEQASGVEKNLVRVKLVSIVDFFNL